MPQANKEGLSEKEMQCFRTFFREYCKQQILTNSCATVPCSTCPVNLAVEKIFGGGHD